MTYLNKLQESENLYNKWQYAIQTTQDEGTFFSSFFILLTSQQKKFPQSLKNLKKYSFVIIYKHISTGSNIIQILLR